MKIEKISQETKEYLESEVVRVVLECYKNYFDMKSKGVKYKEPNMTVTMVKEMLSMPGDWFWLSKKSQYYHVNQALNKAKKLGKLNSSIGIGLKNKEARCYEPLGIA